MRDLIYPLVFLGTIGVTWGLVHLSPLAVIDGALILTSACVKVGTIGKFIKTRRK